MSQSEKSEYYQALKARGVSFDKHYREYNTEALKAAWVKLTGSEELPYAEQVPAAPPTPAAPDAEAASFYGFQPEPETQATSSIPVRAQDPNEMPGVRLNTKDLEEPVRIDENGLVWLQEEIRKPAYPKSRGRRVLKYMDAGAVQQTVKDGQYIETFEVSGDPANARPAEVKVTLPSYQVGIYKDPRFPFKVHTYNGNSGFDLFEVQDFYGGSELVPAEVKRIYVENVLCYDIRSVVQAIEKEYRQRVLGQGAS